MSGLRNVAHERWLVPAIFLLTVVLACALYAGSARNDFVWDDPRQDLQAFQSIRDAFFPPPRIPLFGGVYYRPVVTLSYMLDRQLDASIWKDSHLAFHVPAIVLHALNSGFVFLIGLGLCGSRARGKAAAAAAGLLFAAHPIHTESVCWMAGRSDTLATFFILPSLLCYFAWRRAPSRRMWLAWAAALFLLGCLTKETALALLAIVAAADLLGLSAGEPFPAWRRGTGSFLPGWLALAGAAVMYFVLRSWGLAGARVSLARLESSFGSSVERVVQALGFYTAKVLVPSDLQAFMPEIPNPDLCFATGIAILIVGGLLIWAACRRREGMALFLGVWYFASLAPSLAPALFSMSETPVAERYLYLPSAAFCLALGYSLFLRLPDLLAVPARRPATWVSGVLVLALTAFFSVLTVRRGQDWRTCVGFWKVEVARSPHEGLPRMQLGLAYANQGRSDLAELEYLEAISPSVEYDAEGRSITFNNLGMLYLGDPEKAGGFFSRAIELRPDYATPYYGLGRTALIRAEMLAREGRGEEAMDWYRKAEPALRRALELNPSYVKAFNQLAHLLADTGRPAEALQHIETILRLTTRGTEHDAALQLRSRLTARAPSPAAGQAR